MKGKDELERKIDDPHALAEYHFGGKCLSVLIIFFLFLWTWFVQLLPRVSSGSFYLLFTIDSYNKKEKERKEARVKKDENNEICCFVHTLSRSTPKG